jgi:phage terminase large subunit GpA-like protein
VNLDSSPSIPVLSRFPDPHPVLSDFRSALSIPPRRTLSSWSEENIVLSPEYSNRTGKLELFGWQRAIFDAFTDPDIEEIVIMTSTQVVKSLVLMCALAYVIAEDPGPVLIVEPKDEAARQFSKRRLAPLIRDTHALHGKISMSSTDGQNTILSKEFVGGNLLLVSARTPADLAQHTIRYLFCDEVDKYLSDVGGSEGKEGEGDPIELAWKRAMTYGSRRKLILACSPTTAGSRISRAYARSDQRKPYVPCPQCGHLQILKFRDKEGPLVRWDTSVAFESAHLSAQYHCSDRKCDHAWTEIERWEAANEHVIWRPDKPERSVENGGKVAGFWINHLYVPYTWKTVPDIAKNFLQVQNQPQELKTFINTVLAEEYVAPGETPDKEVLYNRREDYPFNDEAVIPQRALFLTAFTDVQESPPRLECEISAWGRGRERWSIAYYVIQAYAENGQPLPATSRELWDILERDILNRDFIHESGRTLPILAMGVDTGKLPKPVYDFARRHPQLRFSPATGIQLHSIRTVVPTKGDDDDLRIISKISKEDATRKRQGVRIISIGTHCAKGEIFNVLRHVTPKPNDSLSGEPVHSCYHFPKYDLAYFETVASEKRVVSGDKVEFHKIEERNEGLDNLVGNRAMAAIVGIDRFNEERWRQFEHAVRPLEDDEVEDLTNEIPESVPNSVGPNLLDPRPSPPSANPASVPLIRRSTPSPSSPSPPASPRRPIRGSFV